MRRWYAGINPQHTMLFGPVDCVIAAAEDQLSKPVPGRRS